MATSVTTSGITFNDATTQTTAAFSSGIKSIQRGTISITPGDNNITTKSATISAVTPSKTMLKKNGQSGSAYYADPRGTITLSNSTTVTLDISTYLTDSVTIWVNFEVVEFY